MKRVSIGFLSAPDLITLTLSGASRYTLSSGTVDSASILLEGSVGNAASAVGSLASLDLAASDTVDALDVGDSGRRDGNEAEKSSGDGETHIDWCLDGVCRLGGY